MKIMGAFLALMFLMYSIVSFIYIDPATNKPRPSVENTAKGMIYLGVTLTLAYFVMTI
jgi:hypothetical protein